MTARLGIFCCHNFHAEVGAGVTAEGWDDVVAVAFPARCGRPPVTWDELRPFVPADCAQVVVLGRACLTGLGPPPADFPPVRLLPVAQCFHLVAGEQLVNEAIAGGGYLITSAWLADWRSQIKAMGFDPEQAGDFFHDFARELVLLDTGLDPETGKRLAELQDAVKLPARRIAVGLDYTRLLLVRLVLEWRLEQAQRTAREQGRRHAGELADHVSAMDLLTRLAQTQKEAEAIAAIDELFHMLFAPATWHYLRVERGHPVIGDDIPADLLAGLQGMDTPWAWTPSGTGFLLRIAHGEHLLGLVAVDGLAFPEYRERYLNMALAMSGVCALAIENARTRKRLVEAEKMASLGIMVAGVAHEINTPVGVGLVAASTLQEQSQRLAQRFATRVMTQSDLQGYLDAALAETGLIRSNLERISQLIDAFRQVAVEGKPLPKRRFNLKNCLDDVIASLGPRLPADRIAVRVRCDEALEIESFPGDWASIFTNLITNSLQHGFKGRDQGHIDIAVTTRDGQLVMSYTDDGVGLSPEARTRIFDPFFTTDLQHGTGLGMHLVYNLVTHRLGGSIACYSPPGRGAQFQLEMPL